MNDPKNKLVFLTYIFVSIGLSETVTTDEVLFSFLHYSPGNQFRDLTSIRQITYHYCWNVSCGLSLITTEKLLGDLSVKIAFQQNLLINVH